MNTQVYVQKDHEFIITMLANCAQINKKVDSAEVYRAVLRNFHPELIGKFRPYSKSNPYPKSAVDAILSYLCMKGIVKKTKVGLRDDVNEAASKFVYTVSKSQLNKMYDTLK